MSGAGQITGGGGFTPATSIEDAEKWATKNITKKVDYQGVDIKVANEINKQLYTARQENLILDVSKINKIGGAEEFNVGGNSFSIVQGRVAGRAERAWQVSKDTDNFLNAFMVLPKDKALEQLVTHEIGHLVDYKIDVAKMGGYLDKAIEKKAKSIKRKWTKIYNANKDRLPSDYAEIAGSKEGFAEVYSIYRIEPKLLDNVFVSHMDEAVEFASSFGN